VINLTQHTLLTAIVTTLTNKQTTIKLIMYTHCHSNYNAPNSKQPILIHLTTFKLIAIICLELLYCCLYHPIYY